ncbi:MAG: phycobiliprotein lyase [Cyanobacteria bacterium RI_101]|nr:phycobiliprotein lyase [Cyanobacteria bacterium RI_101]
MDLPEFLHLCAGKWFSQRTRYAFGSQTAESHKSEIVAEVSSQLEPDLSAALAAEGYGPSPDLLILKLTWETTGDWGKPKKTGAVHSVFLPDSPRAGRLWRAPLPGRETGLSGAYELGEDEGLAYLLESGDVKTEERIWFASPNLRLRTCLIHQGTAPIHSAFYSEIRKLPPQPAS